MSKKIEQNQIIPQFVLYKGVKNLVRLNQKHFPKGVSPLVVQANPPHQ